MDLLFERGKYAGSAGELIAGKTSSYTGYTPLGYIHARTSDILHTEYVMPLKHGGPYIAVDLMPGTLIAV